MIFMLGLSGVKQQKEAGKHLSTMNWISNQLYYKFRTLPCLFSYDTFDKSLLTKEQADKAGLVVVGFFATYEYSYGYHVFLCI